MAEPLSIAASVAGLVSLGLQSVDYLVQYYSAYRDRDTELARIADRLGDLLQLLRTIDNILQTRKWRTDERTILQGLEKSISRCEDVILELRDEVRKLKKEPTDTLAKAVKAIGRHAAYPLRRSTLVKLDEDVGAFRDNLSTAMQVLQLKEHRNTQDDIEEMKSVMKNARAEHLANSVRDWLRAPDTTIDFNAACAKRHAGTGQWFIQNEVFTTWLQQENSFLWLYGFAGCGKSVLCSTAILHTFRHQRSQAGSAVAFFFFSFNNPSTQHASAALPALLLQLSAQITGLDAELIRLKDSYKNGTPPVPILMECLRQAVARSCDVYILLDALDECPVEDSRADVLAMIQTMRQWSLPGLHVLVTSRDVPDIRDHLQSQVNDQDMECVALKNDSVQKDILHYVSYQVDNDPQLQRWGDHRAKIKQHLTEHAGGVFRWVECQLRPLRQCARSVKHLEKCLNALPQSLDSTYERMLCSIGDESREEAQRILTLLCHSPRPLSVEEVIDALAVDLDDLECFDCDRKLESADDLVRICPGLIEIVFISRDDDSSDGDDSSDEDEAEDGDKDIMSTQIVRIAHFSVQEYLLSDRIKRSDAADFAMSDSVPHLQISKLCLLYLSNEEFLRQTLTRNLLDQYPLAVFAAEYWHDYYKRVDLNLAKQLTERAITLLTTEKTLDRWIRLYNPDERYHGVLYDDLVRYHASPTYYAALLGLDSVLARFLSNSNTDVSAQGGRYGSALQAASVWDREKTVQMLLDAGADVNAQGGEYGSALQAASVWGQEKTVQILLDAGADVNAQGGYYGSVLQAASVRGQEKIVQMLLDAGADVNAQGGYYGNALQAASATGQEKTVQMLLDAWTDVNAQGGRGGNALQAALVEGQEKIVQKLLDAGADVNAQGGHYGNALQAASATGQEKTVPILLDAGADVNAQGGYYGSALQAASARGEDKIVQMLLDAGAIAHAQGGHYGNALQAASAMGEHKIVQMLLDAGADAHAQEIPLR